MIFHAKLLFYLPGQIETPIVYFLFKSRHYTDLAADCKPFAEKIPQTRTRRQIQLFFAGILLS